MRFPLAFLALALSVVACGKQDNPLADANGSTLSQLTRTDYGCKQWTEARISAVKSAMPNTFLKGWRDDALDRVYQAVAGIPDPYLAWLYDTHKRNGFSIKGQNPGFPGGVTELDDIQPIDMKLLPEARIVDLCLQHEVGHALTPYLWNVASKNKATFETAFSPLADGDYSNSNLNAYPRTYPRGSEVYHMEYLAEAFNSFYCSEDTSKMLREQFPGTFAFLAKTLLPPVWDATDSTTPAANQDIFVFLEPKAANPKMWIASSSDVKSVRLCLDTELACRKSLKNDLAFKSTTVSNAAGRAFYEANGSLTLKDGLVVTVLGLDASDKLVSSKSMRLAAQP